MPYIKGECKRALFNETLGVPQPQTPGELNYLITVLVIEFIKARPEGLCYSTINDAVGAMESAKAEFQRRVVAPYEDRKIRENGDVYPTWLLGEKR